MKRQKEKIIIYNEHGKINRLETFLNNHDYLIIIAFILAIFLGGLFD